MKTTESASLGENHLEKGLGKGFHSYNGRDSWPHLGMAVCFCGLRKRRRALGNDGRP